MKVARLAYARFTTPQFERQLEYYLGVLGLMPSDRTRDSVHLRTRNGHLAVILEAGEQAACTSLGFEVGQEADLDALRQVLTTSGVALSIKTDFGPGLAHALAFKDPNGTGIEIVQGLSPVQTARQSRQGVSPLKLGHVAFKAREIRKVVSFYADVLGFRVSDWRGDFFVFMRCGADHHTVNFVTGDQHRMHHIAFEVSNGSAMLDACDQLGIAGIPLIWGPGRHLIGGNMFTYHRNPDAQIMELYADLAQMKSEELGAFDPKPWHADDVYRPKDWGADVSSNLWGIPSPPGFRD